MSELSAPDNIFTTIQKISTEMDAIGKNRRGQGINYSFRGVDDIYNALHPLLAKYGAVSVPEVLNMSREERQTKNGGAMTYTILTVKYRLYALDGSHIESVVMGEAADHSDKSCNKAMSAAHKYFFMQTFTIPTEDEKDTEAVNEPFAPRQTTQPSTARQVVDELNQKNVISEPQRIRLRAIATEMGWKDDEVKALIKRHGYESSKDIKKTDYDNICNQLKDPTEKL